MSVSLLRTNSSRTSSIVVRVRAATTAVAVIALHGVAAPAVADTDFGYRMGVNASGLEFAEGTFPGTLGTTYIAPTASELGYYAGKDMGIVRLPFAWERLQPTLSGAFDATYLGYIQAAVASARGNGMMVLLDPHNYAMYRPTGQNRHHIGSSTVPVSSFVDLWTRLAELYAGDPGVVFGLMNEPVQWDDYGEELQCAEWAGYANQAIAAIRAAGATDNWIFVPGNFWTGAWSWSSATDTTGTSNATAMLAIADSAGKFAFEVHQYLDSNYSGTSDTCDASHGSADLATFTTWLQSHGHVGFLGEIGAGSNTTCYDDLNGVFDLMESNTDVWAGFTYWASSNWSIQFSIEPTNWQYQSNSTQSSTTPQDATMMTQVLADRYALAGSVGACAGDLNADHSIDAVDLARMLTVWGVHPLGHAGDLNFDGEVNHLDLAQLLERWGACP